MENKKERRKNKQQQQQQITRAHMHVLRCTLNFSFQKQMHLFKIEFNQVVYPSANNANDEPLGTLLK